MTVYAIVQLKMTDRAAYDRYQARFFDVFKKFSGRLLSADENPAVLEGAWDRDKPVRTRWCCWPKDLDDTMWTSAKAPSLAEMEAMAHDALTRLPKAFRDLCEGVIIRVEDFPTEEVLDEMGAESEFDLLGLFQGIGLPHQSHGDVARLPNLIWLYRRPILDYWAEHDETLGHIVRHVLIHEIGHHFGLSDDDMAAIEALAL
jgi:predicted Zn-dependent protease with MMP-like domain